MSHRDRHARSDSEPASIYIRNLPEGTDPQELREVFLKYGTLKDCYIPVDYRTRRQRGFGYVQYHLDTDAREAMHALQHSQFGNVRLELEWARSTRKTPNEMAKRTGAGRRRDDDRGHDRDNRYRDRRSRSHSRSHDRSRYRQTSRHSRSRSRSRKNSRSRRSYSRSRSRSPHRAGAFNNGHYRDHNGDSSSSRWAVEGLNEQR